MDAADLARRFGLGEAARLSDGPVARGKQGLVWRLDTADGSWAVKVPLHRSSEEEVRLATALQEAAYPAGVPTPQVRRTTEGRVFAMLEGKQVRVYEWVDLCAPDARLDPGRVGAIVGTIHRVSAVGLGPLDPCYHEPIGAERWDHLAEELAEAGAQPLAPKGQPHLEHRRHSLVCHPLRVMRPAGAGDGVLTYPVRPAVARAAERGGSHERRNRRNARP